MCPPDEGIDVCIDERDPLLVLLLLLDAFRLPLQEEACDDEGDSENENPFELGDVRGMDPDGSIEEAVVTLDPMLVKLKLSARREEAAGLLLGCSIILSTEY